MIMKKYKSFIPTLGAALLLSLGSAFCAQAADIGWVTEDGTWRYKDASGNYVTNTWKTSGDSSFYLGSDGKMTVNQWIDDEYYVNDSGAMVKKFLDPHHRGGRLKACGLVLYGF